MLTTSPTAVLTDLDTTAEGDALCAACPHQRAAHDEIGARYCAATTSHDHKRGCICSKETIDAGTTR